VPKDTSQPTKTISASNILNMWARLIASSRKNAVWFINQDSEPQLSQLIQPIKNVAGTENVGGIAMPFISYVPPGVNGAVYGSLLGRPVVPVEYCSTLGTAGDIVLADMSQYLAINKGGLQADSSIHVRFINDETVFRFVYRCNGQPLLASAITPYRGTNTISPFIALQTR
jgi:HK97 family phage major capsid protein